MEDQQDNFKAWDPQELQPSGEVGYTPATVLKISKSMPSILNDGLKAWLGLGYFYEEAIEEL